jgi:hypothetical protein
MAALHFLSMEGSSRMSGMVGVIANDTARYSMFSIATHGLHTPKNTAIQFALTGDRILGRNKLAQMAIDQGQEWLLFLDDDHTFPSDLLTRLLAHNLPIVGALYLQRQMPFLPIAYATKDDDEKYWPVDLNQHGENDLLTVRALGTGGMLIRTEILRALEVPWFEHGRASEDLIFCDHVYEAGLGPIYCDLGARMGHLSPAALWPTFTDGRWAAGFALADGFSVTVDYPE